MAFVQFLSRELKYYKSLHDHNFLYEFDEIGSILACIIAVHVDDLLVLAMKSSISWAQQQVER
eukprot:1763779-Pyramimonas_sp.AAC.1